jgi:hypothetical protein
MSSATLPHVTFLDLSHDDPEIVRALSRRLMRLAELALSGLTSWSEHSTAFQADLALVHEVAAGARYFSAANENQAIEPAPGTDGDAVGSNIVPFRPRRLR